MARSAPHPLHAHWPDAMRLRHLIVWVLALLLAIAWFAGWILPAF
jgi:hypothetical protein